MKRTGGLVRLPCASEAKKPRRARPARFIEAGARPACFELFVDRFSLSGAVNSILFGFSALTSLNPGACPSLARWRCIPRPRLGNLRRGHSCVPSRPGGSLSGTCSEWKACAVSGRIWACTCAASARCGEGGDRTCGLEFIVSRGRCSKKTVTVQRGRSAVVV